MGLFLGVSILSIVEIVYFMAFRKLDDDTEIASQHLRQESVSDDTTIASVEIKGDDNLSHLSIKADDNLSHLSIKSDNTIARNGF